MLLFLNLDWGQISPHASISNIKNFKHFSCLCPVPHYLLLHLLQLRRSPSWSFPCPLCSFTPPTGFSPSRRDGFLQMDALKRPRILFARLQGGAYLHNHYPERYVLKISISSHHFVMIFVCKGQMGEFSRLSGNSSLHLRGTAATAAKVWMLTLELNPGIKDILLQTEAAPPASSACSQCRTWGGRRSSATTFGSGDDAIQACSLLLKTQPTNVITGDSPRTHILIRIPTFTASRS